GSVACVTRRVGGDQNDSPALSACRLTNKKEPTSAIPATQAQNRIKPRGESILQLHPTIAATVPSAPLKVIIGANARRYSAERSINVRMTCRCSAAQFDSMRILCITKSSLAQVVFPRVNEVIRLRLRSPYSNHPA